MKKIHNYDTFLNEDKEKEKEESKKVKKVIDMKKLAEYSTSIMTICNGEYGNVFVLEEENKVFVCLGDANPFDSEDLMWTMRDAIKKNYNVKDEDIEIEIENECMPPKGEDWQYYTGKRYVKY